MRRHINIRCIYSPLSEIKSLQAKRYTYYNSNGIKNEQNRSPVKETDKLWIDISDPLSEDLKSIAKEFDLDEDSLRRISQKTEIEYKD
ncbi:hypothetical protein [Candidatus Nitrosocosmicus arcticus]|uniref:Uncharacterized protein n=1 Tax=Candidatus Nitrosocosmicus arcticus TaxID=2035267 RepID=A0A557SVN7_9ARCH|nr:hypothetical protein [Candidatus Nitrosocosmicus arcticus]TVP40670.1 hypothetical protein NARC_60057 [Candidatus Nitrosocosmicus arcticus]